MRFLIPLMIVLLFLVQSVVAEELDDTANWDNPQVIQGVPNNNFFQSIQNHPELLTNEYVFASLEARMRDQSIAEYVSRNRNLLDYWAREKGIAFEENAGLLRYDQGIVVTQGKQVAFRPEDLPGAIVLADGTVRLAYTEGATAGEAFIESGEIMSRDNDMVTADTIFIRNGRIAYGSTILETDGIVEMDVEGFHSYSIQNGKTWINDREQIYELFSDGTYEISLAEGKFPHITNPPGIGGGETLSITGALVPISLGVSSGTSLDGAPGFYLDEHSTVDLNKGVDPQAIQVSISVDHATYVCLQCSSEGIVTELEMPPEERRSLIMFPKGLTYHEPVVITSSPGDNIVLDIDYGTVVDQFKGIYADSGDGHITVLQTGFKKTPWYDPRDSYFSAVEVNKGLARMSSAVISPSQIIFSIDGATMYLPERDAQITDGKLSQGSILVLEPGHYGEGPSLLREFDANEFFGNIQQPPAEEQPAALKQEEQRQQKKAPPRKQAPARTRTVQPQAPQKKPGVQRGPAPVVDWSGK